MVRADDDEDDMFKDAYDDEDYYKNAKNPQKGEIYDPDILKELEDKYHEANVNMMKRATVKLNPQFIEEEK